MDVEHILHTLNQHSVEYILIGGMNFLFNHSGPISEDVDIFINDIEANRIELNFALKDLQCQCCENESALKPVSDDPKWLENQNVVCLTSPYGALDVYRNVPGLEDGFDACKSRAEIRSMPNGEFYFSLSDEDMIRTEETRGLSSRNDLRIAVLKKAIEAKRKRGR